MLIGAFDIYFQCLHNRSFHVTKNRLSSVQLKLDIACNAILTWIRCFMLITEYNAGTLDMQCYSSVSFSKVRKSEKRIIMLLSG